MSITNYSTVTDYNSPPTSDELEISIIGTGFGECILAHVGHNEWIIHDSCLGKDGVCSAALCYLSDIGVDVKSAVKLVIATHWDDDHIRGLSTIIEACDNADFCISGVLSDKKFTKLVTDSPLQRWHDLNKKVPTGLSEFLEVYRLLSMRSKTIRRLQRDQRVWKSDEKGGAEIIALSPHENIYEKALNAIFNQLPAADDAVGNISGIRPNFTSVATVIRIGKIQILLGADLEESNEHKGWSLIVNESSYKKEIKCSVYKVAHHGSHTGNSDQIWTELLLPNPICAIAPFVRNPKLPRQSDLEYLAQKSDNIYVCAPSDMKAKEKSKEKLLRRAYDSKNAKEIVSGMNIIRLRAPIETADWQIGLFGKAYQYKNG